MGEIEDIANVFNRQLAQFELFSQDICLFVDVGDEGSRLFGLAVLLELRNDVLNDLTVVGLVLGDVDDCEVLINLFEFEVDLLQEGDL